MSLQRSACRLAQLGLSTASRSILRSSAAAARLSARSLRSATLRPIPLHPHRSIHSAAAASSDDSSAHASAPPADDPRLATRESMEYDVVIVGAGVAGLSAALRLKTEATARGHELSVCVVEKGAEVGAHILSGNVFDPRALDELMPGWREDESCPVKVPVQHDKLFFLTKTAAIPLPVAPSLHNKGNFIISLAQLTRWMASKAEAAGVEIYPGFAAAEVLYNDAGAVAGIATKDVGIGKDGSVKDTFARGMELRGKQTLFAEGTRGSLSELVMTKYNLRANADPQTYGLGIKEVWEVSPDKFKAGLVQHTIGWPSPSDTWSGSFCYHYDTNKVLVGLVVGLDYSNTYISPYAEMQQFKTHPIMKDMLAGGKCVEYGARVINEGGYQSIPKLTFPGGALIGCSAGFLNVARVKGAHTAMKSGLVAADTILAALKAEPAAEKALVGQELSGYGQSMEKSWVYSELKAVRNVHPSFHKFGGLYGFMIYSGLQMFVLRGNELWTFRNKLHDHERTKPASECTPITYPKPDGVFSFDLLTNLQRSGVKHNEDQPSHLRIKKGMEATPIDVSWKKFKAPETRFCPARVYEVHTDDANPNAGAKLQINNTNCVHCKSCAIKTPNLYIDWTVPEGGGGPAYQNM